MEYVEEIEYNNNGVILDEDWIEEPAYNVGKKVRTEKNESEEKSSTDLKKDEDFFENLSGNDRVLSNFDLIVKEDNQDKPDSYLTLQEFFSEKNKTGIVEDEKIGYAVLKVSHDSIDKQKTSPQKNKHFFTTYRNKYKLFLIFSYLKEDEMLKFSYLTKILYNEVRPRLFKYVNSKIAQSLKDFEKKAKTRFESKTRLKGNLIELQSDIDRPYTNKTQIEEVKKQLSNLGYDLYFLLREVGVLKTFVFVNDMLKLARFLFIKKLCEIFEKYSEGENCEISHLEEIKWSIECDNEMVENISYIFKFCNKFKVLSINCNSITTKSLSLLCDRVIKHLTALSIDGLKFNSKQAVEIFAKSFKNAKHLTKLQLISMDFEAYNAEKILNKYVDNFQLLKSLHICEFTHTFLFPFINRLPNLSYIGFRSDIPYDNSFKDFLYITKIPHISIRYHNGLKNATQFYGALELASANSNINKFEILYVTEYISYYNIKFGWNSNVMLQDVNMDEPVQYSKSGQRLRKVLFEKKKPIQNS